MKAYYVVINGDFTDNSPYRSSTEAQSEADTKGGTIETHNTDAFDEPQPHDLYETLADILRP